MSKTHLDPESENDNVIQKFMAITAIIITAIVAYVLIYENISNPEIDTTWSIITIIITATVLLLVFYPTIRHFTGARHAKTKIRQQEKVIQNTNPYTFFKELPNDYGIGVTSLLFDSTLENEKDIVAAILDLCAQKYLHLSKHSDHYVIYLNPTPTKQPLHNEAYLLERIYSNHIQQINYQTWYKYCLQDGIDLGLYRPTIVNTPRKKSPILQKYMQFYEKCSRKNIIAAIAVTCMIIITICIIFINIDSSNPVFPILALTTFACGIGIPTIFSLIAQFAVTYNQSITAHYTSYKRILENQLTRTEKGITELQKLYAFKSFLTQFNTFVDKNPEAVVLWDRYLSYAQVFGLTSSIMKSGYKELIDNASFNIDSINDITLQNLIISNT